MAKIYFTSDQHFGHLNILNYCLNRSFSSIEEMNEGLINNFNETVTHEDITYHVGDFTLSKRHINFIKRLNGTHHLICGNHDACYPWKNFKQDKVDLYLEAGFASVQKELELEIESIGSVLLNHLPYQGDSHDEDRYKEHRPIKNPKHRYLIHGHCHSTDKLVDNMIHVGVDAWDCKPVSILQIIQLIKDREKDHA